MNLKFLKPSWLNGIITVVILFLPILSERVPLITGGYVIERYSPIVLIFSYALGGDYYPLLLMLGFALFIYIVVSVAIMLLIKIAGAYARFKRRK